jgi:hypothetical protein
VPLTDVVIELQEGDRLRGVPQSVNSAGPAAKEGKEDSDG